MTNILFISDVEENFERVISYNQNEFPKCRFFIAGTKNFLTLHRLSISDLIFIDGIPCLLNGLKICESIRKNRLNNDVQLVLILPKTYSESLKKDAYKLGVNGFIEEPVNEIDITLKIKALLEYKTIKSALYEKEQKFDVLYQHSPDMIASVSIQDHSILNCNETLLKKTGFSKEELVGEEVLRLFHNDSRLAVNEIYDRIQKKRSGYDNDLALKRKDGNLIHVSVNSEAIKDPNDATHYLIFSFHDITAHKKSKEELEKALLNWDRSFNSINDVMIILDEDQNIIQCNSKTTDVLQKTSADIIGKKCHDVVHHTDGCIDGCPFLKMKKTGKRESMELNFSDNYYDVIVDPVYDKQNKLTGAVHILKNITESKRFKEQIQKERMLLRTLIDNLPTIIYFKDNEGRKLIANKADVENMGLQTEAQTIGKNDMELFSGEVGKRGYYDDMEVVKSGKAIYEREEYFMSGKGVKKWVSTSKLPLKNTNGEIIGLVGIGHDITEQKRVLRELTNAKEKAEESDRLKSAFLANMSHEIRTPMNGILGFIELLKDAGLDNEDKKKFIDIVSKSGNRLLSTINDIIDISKIDAGQMPVYIEEVDVLAEINEVFNFFRLQCNELGLQLKVEISAEIEEGIRINTDALKVNSVLTNLIKNAIKFTKQGEIVIGLIKKNECLEFYVKDTGVGIPLEKRSIIFNRFEQADSSATRAFEGSGLGLAISKAYVEMLGGKIRFEANKDSGTTFYFCLPLIFPGEDKMKINKRETEECNCTNRETNKKLKLLIAEDDEVSYTYLSAIFEGINCDVVHVTTGDEAIEYCMRNDDVDIILMDIKMPGTDGLEATRRIREFNNCVFIIAQTANAMDGDEIKTINAGCNKYISKPINRQKLLNIIYQYMENKPFAR